MSDHTQRDLVRAQFGANANAYVASCVHAGGSDLDQLVKWAEGGPEKTLLDVATGGGHTALAMSRLYGSVTASDITRPMLEAAEEFTRTQGATNITFQTADAEALPFDAGAFDAVSCRIAPHHFPRPDRFVNEVARVLKPSGIFLFEDSVVPEDPTLAECLNDIERARDPSHLRSLTELEWTGLIEDAGFLIEEHIIDRKRRNLADWFTRARTPADRRAEVERLFLGAGPAGREAFVLEFAPDGSIEAYSDEKLLVKARN
ncbi:MAG TPA: methyltransferase domain-containing protein [Chloroflexota bacterium]|jgi:ubiquinone/menaquinone biosynthesis C-methylase UbiE|nr:methyltransferase domain-containing protein [Chloroflexota bacterium]